jgi:hypothetical protein
MPTTAQELRRRTGHVRVNTRSAAAFLAVRAFTIGIDTGIICAFFTAGTVIHTCIIITMLTVHAGIGTDPVDRAFTGILAGGNTVPMPVADLTKFQATIHAGTIHAILTQIAIAFAIPVDTGTVFAVASLTAGTWLYTPNPHALCTIPLTTWGTRVITGEQGNTVRKEQ